jgi:hypothetical protein
VVSPRMDAGTLWRSRAAAAREVRCRDRRQAFELFLRYDIHGPVAPVRPTDAALAKEFGTTTDVTNQLAWAHRIFRAGARKRACSRRSIIRGSCRSPTQDDYLTGACITSWRPCAASAGIVGIIVGSRIKGVLKGVIIGWFAKRSHCGLRSAVRSTSRWQGACR